jgi:hypothetical protein
MLQCLSARLQNRCTLPVGLVLLPESVEVSRAYLFLFAQLLDLKCD